MATAYKTPGVYVEEITKLPPSIAEVETAIPAFVGYTNFAKRYVDDDLLLIPMRITSLLEYEQYFGTGPSYTSIHVQVDAQNKVDDANTTVTNSIYNLYESIRLFYDNGGGVCYICSVGYYADNDIVLTRTTNIRAGLDELRKYDEPTLLLFPDAVNLKNGTVPDWDKIASVQQAALQQCGDLGDRFAILDVADDPAKKVPEMADLFRSKIGMNNLKYGAAYMPFVKTTYDKIFRLRDIAKNFYNSVPAQVELKTLFSDSDTDAFGVSIKTKLDNFKKTYTDNDAISSGLSVYTGKLVTDPFAIGNLDTMYQAAVGTYNGAVDDAGRTAALKSLFEFVFYTYAQLEGLATAHAAITAIKTSVITNTDLRAAIVGVLSSTLKSPLQSFRNLDNEAYRLGATSDISNTNADKPGIDFAATFTTAEWQPAAAANDNQIDGLTLTDKQAATKAALNKLYEAVKTGINTIIAAGVSFEAASENALIGDIPIYNSIVTVLNNKVNVLPPSGGVAGVYASVDNDRGVWKAPANVSLNSVSSLNDFIDDNMQENLNVDANAGKSVNALRAFYGKGILVWGARTLAGNDNEWRYVPVRRFFSFVEESCKKSTSWVVFEPNDANTWLRVKAQIENFLNNLWRRGALAGAKPEHAYVVNCGLGVTMTAQDILEGRLNVEVAMAAVRPAEFVILKFSHKLQQS